MSTVDAVEQHSPSAENGADNQRKIEALRRLIQRGQGRFAFVLVEFDLPRQRDTVLTELSHTFKDLNVVTVALTPPPPDAPRSYNVLDQLNDRVKTASPDKDPAVLIIAGYETLFADAVDAPDGRPTESLARAVQPLNLGRNILAETFRCPVLLFLPSKAMGVFLRSAPDLSSWRSGYYQFQSDADAVKRELAEAVAAGTGWWARRQLRRRQPEELYEESLRLESLIADAEALPAEPTVRARLYERLGWVSVALGNRTLARWAFAELLRMAREEKDGRLTRAAEKGQQAAERVALRLQVSAEQAAAAQQVFRGAAALTEADGLYGREDELRRLEGTVAHVTTRFLTVWGETGCGKTSLVRAGLVPQLQSRGYFLPVVVSQWNDPDASVRRALEQAAPPVVATSVAQRAAEATEVAATMSLHDRVQQVAEQTSKTVVVICDQFEQFFTLHKQRSDRMSFLKAVGECVNDYRLSCKFIFIVREDQLGRMVEFDDDVPEPLEQRKRFYLPLFNAADAARVLRQQSDKADLGWSDAFIRAVVADLTENERVRPIQLQLVSAALGVSGVNNDLAYARVGRAQGLMADYVELVLSSLYELSAVVQHVAHRGLFDRQKQWWWMVQDGQLTRLGALYLKILNPVWQYFRRRWTKDTKQILLALVGDPPRRLTLTPEEIAQRTRLRAEFIEAMLNYMTEAHLVRRIDDQPPDVRYELTHDELVNLVLLVTRDLQDRRRQANRVLRRALEDSTVNPRHTVGLSDYRLVKNNADRTELDKPEAKALLRRCLLVGIIKRFLLAMTFILALAAVQCTTGYVSIERDFADRVTVRRGLPWLSFLPVLYDRVILDTGFKYEDFERRKAGKVHRLLHWEWGNRRSGVLAREKFANALLTVGRGILWCQVGQGDKGVAELQKALKDSDSNVRSAAAGALGQVAQADPKLASQVLPPLLTALKSSDYDVRWAAARALGQVAQADPKLANQALSPLLTALKGSDSNVRSAVTGALGQVARADPKLANQALSPLLTALKSSDYDVRSAAARALGQVAQADRTARTRAFRLLTDYDYAIRTGVSDSLPDLLMTLAEKEPEPIQFLLDHLEGRQSLMRDERGRVYGDANTYAVYRDVVVGAMARWLASNKPGAKELREKLEWMRDHDRRLHLRIAAWNVFVEAAQLPERQEEE